MGWARHVHRRGCQGVWSPTDDHPARALSTEFTRLWDAPLLHDAPEDVGEGEEQVVNPAWEALSGQLENDSDDEDDS